MPSLVKISLSPATTEPFYVGDSILLHLSIANDSPTNFSILYPTLARYSPRTIAFAIKPPNAASYQKVEHPGIYEGPMKALSPPKFYRVLTVGPRGQTNLVFQLDFDCPTVPTRRFLFPTAGRYFIKATVYFLTEPIGAAMGVPATASTKPVETPEISIDVLEPLNELDKSALQAIQKLSYGYLLYAPDQYHEQMHAGAVAQINAFTKDHHHSRYASFGRLFRATAELRQPPDPSSSLNADEALATLRGIGADAKAPAAVRAAAARFAETFAAQNERSPRQSPP
jgi:hypothetical protein